MRAIPHFINAKPLHDGARKGQVFNPNTGAVQAEVVFSTAKTVDAAVAADFRKANLEGASINAAKISGAYFPPELSASEIELSLLHGTRMRYQPKS